MSASTSHPKTTHYIHAPLGECGVGRSRSTCDRCGGRARYAGLGGTWCCGCWSQQKARARQQATAFTAAYDLDDEQALMDALPNEWGSFALRGGEASRRLRYAVDPVGLGAAIVADNKRLCDYQLQLVVRILWGVCLQAGVDLRSFPRNAGYPPEEVPAGAARWAMADQSRWIWLVRYGRSLQEHRIERFGRAHAAGPRLEWLANQVRALRLPFSREIRPVPPGAICLDQHVRLAEAA